MLSKQMSDLNCGTNDYFSKSFVSRHMEIKVSKSRNFSAKPSENVGWFIPAKKDINIDRMSFTLDSIVDESSFFLSAFVASNVQL